LENFLYIVTGDSWGVGEWNPACELSGPGFADLMRLHGQVTNLCFGGGSNEISLNNLENFLEKFTADSSDTIFWVVTCPSRSCTLEHILNCESSYVELFSELLEISFQHASNLASRHNVEINLIGGLCDLDNLDIRYNNLKVEIASISALLCKDYKPSFVCPVTVDWPYILENSNSNRTEALDIADIILSKQQSWNESGYFTTDGQHPDRNGHRIIRDTLFPQFAWKK
jgi:hypothetical protein